jgi:hypothetical protein
MSGFYLNLLNYWNGFMPLLFLMLLVVSAGPQSIDYESARFERKLEPVRIQEEITIDGKLEEASWALAPVATHFIQNQPRPGEPESEETEVRVLYDSENIYFGFFMKESRMKGLVINEPDKDFNTASADNTITVILNTFHDERNGYQFSINAADAKYDAQMINEGRAINVDWDAIWYVKTSRAADGWIAEMAIPFKTLNFQTTSIQIWGINFHRNLRSNGRNEDSYWSALPRIFGIQRVSLAGMLENLEEIRPGANLRIKPYLLGSLLKTGDQNPKLDGEFGLDVKYGI